MERHALTLEASGSREPWARIWRWDALRYSGSGWWLDRILPHSPRAFLLTIIAAPVLWFGCGFALASSHHAYLTKQDVLAQLWFLPLHMACVRVLGGLWANGLEPSLSGLGFDRDASARVRIGALGRWATVGALGVAALFIFRDTWYGLTPDPVSGLIPFDDPYRWNLVALGRPVHVLLLAIWHLEWLFFGYILWLQIWILVKWTRELKRIDLREHLTQILVGDGYRHAFTLISRTATVSLVFAVGNLLFIHLTGELFPRDHVHVATVFEFLEEMSDLLSTTLVFIFALSAAAAFVVTLRRGMTGAVNDVFAEAGDVALTELSVSLPAQADLAVIRRRVNAQSGLLRAMAFQREVDVLGGRVVRLTAVKSFIPIATAAYRLLHMR